MTSSSTHWKTPIRTWIYITTPSIIIRVTSQCISFWMLCFHIFWSEMSNWSTQRKCVFLIYHFTHYCQYLRNIHTELFWTACWQCIKFQSIPIYLYSTTINFMWITFSARNNPMSTYKLTIFLNEKFRVTAKHNIHFIHFNISV